jgi:hypothetical protein
LAKLMIMTADELSATAPFEAQAARREARRQPLVRRILRTFLERGGPIPVDEIIAGSPDGQPHALQGALVALDDDDLIRIRGGQIDIAYPFSAAPTAFSLRLSGGQERYACCALDALGIAPMVGDTIEIASQCHHCGAALHFSATPDGPGPEADGVMVWFGKRADEGCKVADSL